MVRNTRIMSPADQNAGSCSVKLKHWAVGYTQMQGWTATWAIWKKTTWKDTYFFLNWWREFTLDVVGLLFHPDYCGLKPGAWHLNPATSGVSKTVGDWNDSEAAQPLQHKVCCQDVRISLILSNQSDLTKVGFSDALEKESKIHSRGAVGCCHCLNESGSFQTFVRVWSLV